MFENQVVFLHKNFSLIIAVIMHNYIPGTDSVSIMNHGAI